MDSRSKDSSADANSRLRFSGLEFSGIKFSRLDLSGIEFSELGLKFSGIEFNRLEVRGPKFSGIEPDEPGSADLISAVSSSENSSSVSETEQIYFFGDPSSMLRECKNGILGSPGSQEEVCGFPRSPKLVDAGPGGGLHGCHRCLRDLPQTADFTGCRIYRQGRGRPRQMAESVVNSSKVEGSRDRRPLLRYESD